MTYICQKIKGVPYSKHKGRGRVNAPAEWKQTIIDQTKDLPKIREACVVNITFLLPANKFPLDFPYGPVLDNLLKGFLNVLNEIIFSEAPGKASCIVSLNVMKGKIDQKVNQERFLRCCPLVLPNYTFRIDPCRR